MKFYKFGIDVQYSNTCWLQFNIWPVNMIHDCYASDARYSIYLGWCGKWYPQIKYERCE